MGNQQVRVWADGCYDVGHFGHANNLRQAKALGDQLIVGVHSDEEIFKNKKCKPLFNEKERYAMIRGIKWVDEVIEDAPYVTTLETLEKYNCRYCAHGNDITTTADGTDTYHLVKAAGMYKEVERTRGVSTTDIITRILKSKGLWPAASSGIIMKSEGETANLSEGSPWTGSEQPLLSTKRIKEFTAENKMFPSCLRMHNEKLTVVYVCGAFDILHPGHLEFLKAAKNLGDFLIVGVHDDCVVKSYKGDYPIMTLNERYLSLLGCKYVDEVILGAPYSITKDLLEEYRVNLVVDDSIDLIDLKSTPTIDPFKLAKEKEIFEVIDYPGKGALTTEDIIQRVVKRKDEFIQRNKDKIAKELAIYAKMTKSKQG